MSFSIIAAIGQNNELGINQKLLCHLPQDLQYFKSQTLGKTIVMGAKTFKSISHPLIDRKNIVLSRNSNLRIDGVEVCNSLKILLERFCDSPEEIMIIGGAQIYRLFLPYVNKLYITKIQASFLADVYFPDYKEYSKCLKSKSIIDNGYSLDFLEYEKPLQE